jgi:selenide,water dikinase
LVGIETAEDAGVYRLNEDLALVQTADFITPVVDDPYIYGQVAVANALSDIYAMGARPVTAINLLMFDTCRVPEGFLTEILKGGADKLREAGVSLVGGHTVDDLETKFGLSVTGIVHPQKIVRNSTAKVGDFLIYTKPLGIGVLTTAIKADLATEEEVKKVSEVMVHLNKTASEVMVEVGVNACTDVTGFGFLGHLYEMVRYSKVGAEVYSSEFLILEGALNYAGMGLLPAATYDNQEYVGDGVVFPQSFNEDLKMLLFDPQTSGGLLISVPEDKLEELL